MTPEKAFTAVVPLLIGFATILFALSDRIRRWILSRAAACVTPSESADCLRTLLFAPVAVYGGYFGAGMSVMLLALLSVSRGRVPHEQRDQEPALRSDERRRPSS